jgi:uncharacterized membrane protein YbhN (UPF0104 family)
LRRSLQQIALLALALIPLIIFVKITMETQDIFNTIQKIRYFHLLYQAILILAFYLVSGYLYHRILIEFGVHQKPLEWYGLTFVNAFSNYLLPLRAGTMVRALYLRNKYGFLLSHTASSLVYMSYVNLMVILLFGLLVAAGFKFGLFPMPFFTKDIFQNFLTVTIVLCSSLLLCGAALQFAVLRLPFPQPLREAPFFRRRNIIYLFADGARKMACNSRLLMLMIVASITSFLIQVGRLAAAYSAVEASPDFYLVFFVNIFFSLSFLFSIVPGNLGIQEILITISSRLIGISFQNGLVAAAVMRVAALAVVFGFGGYFYLHLGVRKMILSRKPPQDG